MYVFHFFSFSGLNGQSRDFDGENDNFGNELTLFVVPVATQKLGRTVNLHPFEL